MAVFKRRWLMWDVARQRRFDRKEFLMVATKLSELGYNGIGLYLEGAFELKCLGGGIMRKGVMTHGDAIWAKEKCNELGIFLFPMTNVVGHMEHFLRQERFKYLCKDENTRNSDIAFTNPEAKEFVLKIINEYLEAFDTDYIHIGGDEAALNDKTRPLYAEFLSGLCDKLLADGIKVGIWNDLLCSHRELVAPFSRDVEIFDWHYYAHRTQSIEYFVGEGFKTVVACPSDNSWLGFCGHQYTRPWRNDEDLIPVTPDEVEALLVDMQNKGNPENLCGMLAHWEDTAGRDLWGQWSAFARAGLYMNGKFEPSTKNDEAIEIALFGRVTPYTEIMHIIQDEIHSAFYPSFGHQGWVGQAIFMLFNKKNFVDMGAEFIKRAFNLQPNTVEPISKIEKLLSEWKVENDFELYCKTYLVSVVDFMKSTISLTAAFARCEELYTRASKIQFTENEKARELVMEFADGFAATTKCIKQYKVTLGEFINIAPHIANDLVKLDNSIEYTERMYEYLTNFASAEEFALIPLPNINFVVDYAVDKTVIER